MFLYPVNNSIQMSLLTSKIVVHNLLENLKKSKFSALSPLIWLCNKLKYFLFFTGCCACVYKRLIIWLHTHTHTHRIVLIKMSKSKHFLFHTCVGTISVCIQDIFATKHVKRAATHEEYTRNKIKKFTDTRWFAYTSICPTQTVYQTSLSRLHVRRFNTGGCVHGTRL